MNAIKKINKRTDKTCLTVWSQLAPDLVKQKKWVLSMVSYGTWRHEKLMHPVGLRSAVGLNRCLQQTSVDTPAKVTKISQSSAGQPFKWEGKEGEGRVSLADVCHQTSI